jgi:serine/threonine protein phosphatase PrpC
MARQASIEVAVGFSSHPGARPDNQDFAGADLGSPSDRALQGVVVALADGVGGAKGGRIAAELAVRNFLDGYRAQNPLGGIGPAAMSAMTGFNLWLHGQAHSAEDMIGAAATFTGMVLRGREAVVVHIGDSRAWHLRGDALTLLTDDHVSLRPDGSPMLLRALGLEPHLRLDLLRQSLDDHDRLLLTSDGVHSVLSHRAIARLLAARQSPQADADAIVRAALAAGSTDNATAVIVDVVALPSVDHDALAAEIDGLPLFPPPAEGQAVDGFQLAKLLGDGGHARLFVARDGENLVVLKFPKTSLLSEEGARLAFLREAFLGRRIESPFVGRTLTLAEDRQSRLYIAMPFYAGEPLEERIARGTVPLDEAVAISIKLSRGVAALHRLGVAHRDIKPGNVILTRDGGLKLIDLGIARVPHMKELPEKETPGTASFMAPELFEGHRGDATSDQFALGVTIYRLFTGRYPYGEAEPDARPLFGPPVPASRYRPEMSARLEAAIMKAIALGRDDRFADIEELIYQLETGKLDVLPPRRPAPWVQRNPVRFWQAVSLLLLIGLVLAMLRPK